MIYEEGFVKYLVSHLGEDSVIVKPRNIITRCPWCEYNVEKDHYHLHISTEAPIFNCFYCGTKGMISKIFKKLSGSDTSRKFIDREKIKDFRKQRATNISRSYTNRKEIYIPKLNLDEFSFKALYLKQRLGFNNIRLENVKGLVLDIEDFVEKNDIAMTGTLWKCLPLFQQNFVGFVLENQTQLVLRNIDRTASFKHFKIQLQETPMVDYYALYGAGRRTNKVILAEGIFDIFSEFLYDYLRERETTYMYATALNSSFDAALKSVAFNEQLFRIDLKILSDRGIPIWKYKNLKKRNNHLINSISVFYNKTGKDFNETPVTPEKFVI